MNPQLAAILKTQGHMSSRGTTRRATTQPCPHCHQPTITGLDADRCAITARCNPNPLTPLQEAHALLNKQQTWTLTTRAGRPQLDPRHQWNRPSKPANTHTVLTEHKCP